MRSVLQGITCKMINEAPDSGVMEMALAMAESPEWLSKVQVGIYSHINILSLHNVCSPQRITIITNMFLGRMCCQKTFCNFGEKESRLFQNHH